MCESLCIFSDLKDAICVKYWVCSDEMPEKRQHLTVFQNVHAVFSRFPRNAKRKTVFVTKFWFLNPTQVLMDKNAHQKNVFFCKISL